jgi:capsular exopolysaccharide synthesis family protein
MALVSTDPSTHFDAERFAPSLVILSQPTGAAAEAMRGLRTHVMAQHVQKGRRALAVCGATQHVGCTFVAANLAIALSQIGVKTLLLDANLRTPGVEQLISPSSERPGLAQCLSGWDVNFSDFIEPNVLPNLSVIYAGGAAANAQELLAGDRFKRLMDFCLRDFDATLIDTPPANSSADARRIGNVVGYGLIVARRDKTFVEDVKILTAQLQADNARVIGTVLNQA